jgi:hypothetical protein
MAARPPPIANFDTPTLPAAPALAVERRLRPRRGAAAWQQIASTLGWKPATPTRAALLCVAREACAASLADLPAPDTRTLRHLIGHAHSLAELWHLRPELYRVLALRHSQAEAEQRLAALKPIFAALAAPPRGIAALPA